MLLTSGVWKQTTETKKRYPNKDLRYEKASIELTNKYPNLHILAMAKRPKSYDFDLRYLNRGMNVVLNK